MDVKRGMAPDVNGSTAESQHHGSSNHTNNGSSTGIGNGNGRSHGGHGLYLGVPEMGGGGDQKGGEGGAGAGGAAGIGRQGRDFRRTNWTVAECMVLQEAKREDYEKQTNGGAKEKHKTAAERWLAVEDYCWSHSVQRSGQQCKDRWEKMSADFKKIFDHERHAVDGETRFWHMTLDEKKAKRLPSTFFVEVYKGLAQWFGRGGGTPGVAPVGGGVGAGGIGAGAGRAGEIASANGVQGSLGSLLREREGSGKAGSNGNYSRSEDGESDEPGSEPLVDSSSGKKRSSDGDVILGDRNGGTSGRDYRRTNWTLPESLVLQAAKREDLEKQHNNGPKEKHLSAAERWQSVEDYCWSQGVHRSGQQCRDRWDKLSSDFKKISDYEKSIPPDQNAYWVMTPEEKKAKRLPSTFWHGVYSAMAEWFGKNKNIDLQIVIHDTSQPAPREASGNENFFGTDDDDSDPGSAQPVFDSNPERERKGDAGIHIEEGERKVEKKYEMTNWTLQECMVLQAGRQVSFEREFKEKLPDGVDTWQLVEEFCWAQKVYRSSQQCKERWEKMSRDFKKIYNYDRRISGGESTYWIMTVEEKKEKRLPLIFWREVFNEMVKWFTKERIGVIHGAEAPQQEGLGKAGSNGDFPETDDLESDPQSDTFLDSRSRKRRRVESQDSLAVIMEKNSLATQKIMLECEDRKDRRLEKSIEANVQRLERTLEANERIAISYCQAFVALADAIRSITASGSHD